MDKEAKRIAIVIGIGNYINYEKLECCPPSAKEVYKLLISPKYGRCDPNLSILITDEEFAIEKKDLECSLEKAIKNIDAIKDQFLFFFSGHAEVHTDDLYLLFSDTVVGRHWGFSSYKFSTLTGMLNTHSINKSILIVDACHSEVMFNSIKDFQSPWKYTELPSGIAMLSASGEVEFANQDPELKRTLFSYYLCEGIKNNFKTNHKEIYLPETAEYINDRITSNHKNKIQTAKTNVKDNGKQIWLTKKKNTEQENSESYFPFINRESEIKQLSQLYTTTNYWLIDAPSGYGKSFLLNKLKEKFKKDKWQCALIKVNENSTIESIDNELIDILYLHNKTSRIDYEYRSSEKLKEYRLSGQLKKYWQKHKNEFIGIVLLIDFNGKPNLNIADKIFNKVIPNIYNSLNELKIFSSQEKYFRTIFSGRYLSKESIVTKTLNFQTNQLSPFNYETILLALSHFFKDDNLTSTSDFAADLLYFTGGHPHCVVELAKIKKNYSLPNFALFSNDSDINYLDRIAKKVKIISDSINYQHESDYKIINSISVFRFFDQHTLEFLSKSINIKIDPSKLIKMLTSSYLFSRKKRFISNSISRRLLVINFRNEYPEDFINSVKIAKDNALNRINSEGYPEKWVVEFLHQVLQEYSLDLKDINIRKKNKKIFYNELSHILDILYSKSTNEEDILGHATALIEEFNNDWEFIFTINYYFRDKHFNGVPYKELQNKIHDFFNI